MAGGQQRASAAQSRTMDNNRILVFPNGERRIGALLARLFYRTVAGREKDRQAAFGKKQQAVAREDVMK